MIESAKSAVKSQRGIALLLTATSLLLGLTLITLTTSQIALTKVKESATICDETIQQGDISQNALSESEPEKCIIRI